MRIGTAPAADDRSLASPAALRVMSNPPASSSCPWPPVQPQVGRGSRPQSRPQSARFVQDTLTKLNDDNARCKFSGGPSIASSRQISLVELPPPAPVFGVEQPPRALFTVELERWRDAFQDEARECIEELRGVMREAGIHQFTVQLAEMRAADKAENAQLREHVEELLRVNSTLRQVELDHLRGSPASMELCREHFAEEQERWREDDQRWAEQKSQLDLVAECCQQQTVQQQAICNGEEQQSRRLGEQLDQLQKQLAQLEEASRVQFEKVTDIHQRTLENAAAAEGRDEVNQKAMAALASERSAEARWREDREERLQHRTEDEERWTGMKEQFSQISNRVDEATASTASADLFRHFEPKLSQIVEDIRASTSDAVREHVSGLSEVLTERCQQPHPRGVLDTVRDALREALRDVGGNAETRWQQIGALMENLDGQLRLNHQGIEHWRLEAQRWQADADKAKEESERWRDELGVSRLTRDGDARGKRVYGQQMARHASQQGCAAERGETKSPRQARPKRPAKEAETPTAPQDALERTGNALSTPVFGTTAKRESQM